MYLKSNVGSTKKDGGYENEASLLHGFHCLLISDNMWSSFLSVWKLVEFTE